MEVVIKIGGSKTSLNMSSFSEACVLLRITDNLKGDQEIARVVVERKELAAAAKAMKESQENN